MQGVIQKKEFSKNGAPKFQISGTWYFANRSVDLKGLEPGANIEYQWEEFGDDRGRGRPKTITSWKPASNGSAGNTATSSPSGVVTDFNILQSVSNVVGRIGQSGLIKTPEELEKWCVAARMGLTRAMSRAKLAEDESEPDFDDNIPF